jgi:hypothetical protein
LSQGDVPQGQRFSLVYLRRDEQLEDSERMRRRLGATIENFQIGDFNQYLVRQLGLEYKYLNGMKAWVDYFLTLELRDALDAVTIFYQHVLLQRSFQENYTRMMANQVASKWVPEVRRIFAEEQVRYSVDDKGGVHLQVDEQFEVTRTAAVQGMGDPRYAAALTSLEAGYKSARQRATRWKGGNSRRVRRGGEHLQADVWGGTALKVSDRPASQARSCQFALEPGGTKSRRTDVR